MTCCAVEQGLVDVFHLDLGPAEADLIVGGWELTGVEVLARISAALRPGIPNGAAAGPVRKVTIPILIGAGATACCAGADGERRQRQGGCEAERVSASPTAMCHWSVPLIGCRQSVCAATTIVRYFFPIVQTSAIVQPRKSTHNQAHTSAGKHLDPDISYAVCRVELFSRVGFGDKVDYLVNCALRHLTTTIAPHHTLASQPRARSGRHARAGRRHAPRRIPDQDRVPISEGPARKSRVTGDGWLTFSGVKHQDLAPSSNFEHSSMGQTAGLA